MENRHFAFTLLLICAALIPSAVFAQQRPERTIDEIRAEAIHRAEVGQYPLIGLDSGDVKEAFDKIHTQDKDEWAAAFMGVADRYFNEAKALEKLRGGIYSILVKTEEQFAAVSAQYQVVSTKLLGGAHEIRIHSDTAPGDGFRPVDPALEDVYFLTLNSQKVN